MANYIHAKDLRAGHSIIWNNQLYLVLDHSFNKTAMRGGIVKCKIKNYFTNAITVQEFTKEKLEQAHLVRTKASYSYNDDRFYYFLDQSTYELIEYPADKIQEYIPFLSPELVVSIVIYNSQPIDLILPDVVPLTIEFVEDAVRGDTVNALMTKAKTTSGLELSVPAFVKAGDVVNVSCPEGKYKSK